MTKQPTDKMSEEKSWQTPPPVVMRSPHLKPGELRSHFDASPLCTDIPAPVETFKSSQPTGIWMTKLNFTKMMRGDPSSDDCPSKPNKCNVGRIPE